MYLLQGKQALVFSVQYSWAKVSFDGCFQELMTAEVWGPQLN